MVPPPQALFGAPYDDPVASVQLASSAVLVAATAVGALFVALREQPAEEQQHVSRASRVSLLPTPCSRPFLSLEGMEPLS